MEVNSISHAKNSKASSQIDQDKLREKIKAKFGDKALVKKEKKPITSAQDVVEVKTKGGVSNSEEKDFGDIGKNDPNDQLTHDKLKEVLKSGAFSFNDRERATLAKILK